MLYWQKKKLSLTPRDYNLKQARALTEKMWEYWVSAGWWPEGNLLKCSAFAPSKFVFKTIDSPHQCSGGFCLPLTWFTQGAWPCWGPGEQPTEPGGATGWALWLSPTSPALPPLVLHHLFSKSICRVYCGFCCSATSCPWLWLAPCWSSLDCTFSHPLNSTSSLEPHRSLHFLFSFKNNV